MELRRLNQKAQPSWMTLRKRLVDSISDIAMNVEDISFMIIEKFGEKADAVKKEYFQREERFMKKKYRKELKAGDYRVTEDVLVKINADELELIKYWGQQFVLMAKQKYVRAETVKVQKSQQLLDGLDKKPTLSMEMFAKQIKEKEEIDRQIEHKDNSYGQIGEAYGGD